jgi:hypothetical protein
MTAFPDAFDPAFLEDLAEGRVRGWIHSAAFRKLVPPGSVIDATCVATKARRGHDRYVVRYSFAFVHEGERCYEGDQTAMWIRVPLPRTS